MNGCGLVERKNGCVYLARIILYKYRMRGVANKPAHETRLTFEMLQE